MTAGKPRNNNRLSHLPRWISHWLGYRENPPKPEHAYEVYLWSFIGAFCGLSVIQAVLYYAPTFVERHVVFVASFAASAVLCYGSIHLPLAQPRNLIGGHLIAAIIGVCILKLFLLLPSARFDSLLWLSSSLATALAIVVMQATQTIHPPAGATALIPIVDEPLRALGWYYIPVVLLCSALVLGTALVVNNIRRRYPVYWIKPNAVAPAPATPAAGGDSKPADSAAAGAKRMRSESAFPHPDDPEALEDFEEEAEKRDPTAGESADSVDYAPPPPTIGATTTITQADNHSSYLNGVQPSSSPHPVLRLDEFTGWYRNWNNDKPS